MLQLLKTERLQKMNEVYEGLQAVTQIRQCSFTQQQFRKKTLQMNEVIQQYHKSY